MPLYPPASGPSVLLLHKAQNGSDAKDPEETRHSVHKFSILDPGKTYFQVLAFLRVGRKSTSDYQKWNETRSNDYYAFEPMHFPLDEKVPRLAHPGD